MSVTIVGRTYLERGEPVVVLAQWRTGDRTRPVRNVLIRRASGELVVRPFRGLRKPRPASLGSDGGPQLGREPPPGGG